MAKGSIQKDNKLPLDLLNVSLATVNMLTQNMFVMGSSIKDYGLCMERFIYVQRGIML